MYIELNIGSKKVKAKIEPDPHSSPWLGKYQNIWIEKSEIDFSTRKLILMTFKHSFRYSLDMNVLLTIKVKIKDCKNIILMTQSILLSFTPDGPLFYIILNTDSLISSLFICFH